MLLLENENYRLVMTHQFVSCFIPLVNCKYKVNLTDYLYLMIEHFHPDVNGLLEYKFKILNLFLQSKLTVWINLCLDQSFLGKYAFVLAYFCPLFGPQSTGSVNQASDRQDMMAHWEFYKMGILLQCHLKISLHSMTQSRLRRALTVQLGNLDRRFHRGRLIKELSHM